MMSIQGVFFDLGGTLYTYKHVPRSHGELLNAAATRLGMTDPKPLKKAYGTAITALSAEYAEKSYYLHRDLFREAFQRCTELVHRRPPRLGLRLPRNQARLPRHPEPAA